MLLLHVNKVVRETAEASTFFFDRPAGGMPYEPGQFLTLHVPIEGEGYYRSYSLATSPLTDSLPGITVKAIPGGKVSNYLNTYITAGSTLESFPPQGSFMIPRGLTTQYYVFIGGGSGITPLYSMIKWVLHAQPEAQVVLINANRAVGSIIYAKELHTLQETYGTRCRVVHVLSRPDTEWTGLQGRLTPDLLRGLLAGTSAEAQYFLCGPQGLMDMAYTTLTAQQVPQHHIHQESFFVPLETRPPAAVDAEVTLYYEGDTYTYPTSKDESLLNAAMAQGIMLPYACGSGICNTCRAKCRKGKVQMITDAGLSQEEKEEGYILTCVGYATTPEVTLTVE